jgi:hypothetical protein
LQSLGLQLRFPRRIRTHCLRASCEQARSSTKIHREIRWFDIWKIKVNMSTEFLLNTLLQSHTPLISETNYLALVLITRFRLKSFRELSTFYLLFTLVLYCVKIILSALIYLSALYWNFRLKFNSPEILLLQSKLHRLLNCYYCIIEFYFSFIWQFNRVKRKKMWILFCAKPPIGRNKK